MIIKTSHKIKHGLLWLIILLLSCTIMLMWYAPLQIIAYGAHFLWPQQFKFNTVSGSLLQPQLTQVTLKFNYQTIYAEHVSLEAHMHWRSILHPIEMIHAVNVQGFKYQHPSFGTHQMYRINYHLIDDNIHSQFSLQWTDNPNSRLLCHIAAWPSTTLPRCDGSPARA